MDILECLLNRRSTRAYKPTAVEREKLDKIVQAGLYAPSGMNGQPWRFTVVSDGNVLGKLNDSVRSFMSASDIERIRSRATDNSFCFFYRAPTLIIVSCGADAKFPKEDSACALENMFLCAHALGLGSCWINQLCGDINDNVDVRALLSELGIPSDHRVYGCAAIGYAEKQTELKERRGVVKHI